METMWVKDFAELKECNLGLVNSAIQYGKLDIVRVKDRAGRSRKIVMNEKALNWSGESNYKPNAMKKEIENNDRKNYIGRPVW